MTSSTVLGKRTRSSPATATAEPSPSRKRVARVEIPIPILNDENDDNPFITRKRRNDFQDGDNMDIDIKAAVIGARTTPAKHSVNEGRLPLSPSKSKSILNARQDENLNRIQNSTPQTPRHRDAFAKPATPRHRVILAGKPLTPRTPRTPLTPGGSISTVYSQARQIFTRSSEPGRLIGREAEREELSAFVQGCIDKVSGGCTYVSGPPGTGKSAMVSEVTNTFDTSETLQKLYVNCMSIKSSKDLYGNLLENLCGDVEVLEGDEVETLQGIFVSRKKSKTVYVVTLDEIDHILSLDLESLYKLFEWSLQKSSCLVLIGIANALDLTDRFLPRLKARNLKPQLLPFLPYTAAQIKAVILTKLKSLVPKDSATPDYVPFLHPAAIELCSRKVSSQTGDLRKAFDICRRAIDVIEAETKRKFEQELNDQLLQESPSKKTLTENENLASPAKLPSKTTLAQLLSALTVETAPRAMISHLNKITSATFGNGAHQRLKTLNLQQKAALCALVALEKRKRETASNVMATPSKSRVAAPTIKALYDVYCMLCKRDSVLHPLTSTEFRDVIGSLETLSLISAVDGKNGSFVGLSTPSKRARKFGGGIGVGDEKRVGSCVGEKEIAQAVEGVGAGILMNILNGEGLD
jgi:cell division control protein 6